MITFDNLHKEYKTKNNESVKALNGFSLEIAENQVFALAGVNGAGKTTALKALFNLISLDEGSVKISLKTDSKQQTISFAPEIADLPDYLTVEEAIEFSCRLAGFSADKNSIDCAISMFELDFQRSKNIRVLSKGNRQRVSLAAAVAYAADIVVFDEPTSGLDPLGRRLIKNAIKQLKAEGKTVLFSTHMLADLPEICDKMAIVHNGRVIFTGTVSEFCVNPDLEAMEARFADLIKQEGEKC